MEAQSQSQLEANAHKGHILCGHEFGLHKVDDLTESPGQEHDQANPKSREEGRKSLGEPVVYVHMEGNPEGLQKFGQLARDSGEDIGSRRDPERESAKLVDHSLVSES